AKGRAAASARQGRRRGTMWQVLLVRPGRDRCLPDKEPGTLRPAHGLLYPGGANPTTARPQSCWASHRRPPPAEAVAKPEGDEGERPDPEYPNAAKRCARRGRPGGPDRVRRPPPPRARPTPRGAA